MLLLGFVRWWPRSVGALIVLLLGGNAALAQLTIEITGGEESALPVAVLPFAGDQPGSAKSSQPAVDGDDIASVIAADLARSGRFESLSAPTEGSRPAQLSEADLSAWRSRGADYVVVGQVTPQPGGDQLQVQFQLGEAFQGRQLLGLSFTVPGSQLRRLAHHIADQIYQQLTGERGAFATRIAYVSVTGTGRDAVYTLTVADADGYNPQAVLRSRQPLMSPAWSPSGDRLAYVSFEGRRSQIVVQNLYSGSRQVVSSAPGINGAPAWSPDGRRIVFTSDRSGSPQLYEIALDGRRPRRLTFEGRSNARARPTPDGRRLAFVHERQNRFYIALMSRDGGPPTLLSDGGLDESPSIAPNGQMIIYASSSGGRGVLEAVSVDGRVSQRLSASAGQVREPSWSPYIR